jgi:hypothetical protein
VTTTPPDPPPDPDLVPPVGALAERALRSYRATPDTYHHLDTAWRTRAARATRTLAATLGVDPAHIVATPDPVRLYGLLAAPEVLLTVTDPTSQAQYTFIPEHTTTHTFALLAPCPACTQPVPTHQITTLADLGRHLAHPASPAAPDTAHYAADPAHDPTCPHHATSRRATAPPTPEPPPHPAARRPIGPCPCECNQGGFSGPCGCGHRGCGRRR